jgi:hypothetical protein
MTDSRTARPLGRSWQVAPLVGVPASLLEDLAAAGDIPCLRDDAGRTYFDREAVERVLRQRASPAGPTREEAADASR